VFSSHCHFYKLSLPGCWVCAAAPAGRRVCLQFHGRLPLPHSLVLRVLHPLCYVSFLLLLLIIPFFFSPGWESVCPGGYADLAQGCLWEYCVLLSSPCPHLPKWSGCWRLAAREPSWFLHLMWSGDVMHRLGVWRSQSFPSSQWFFL
jgi:hypothetical protein